MARNLRVAVIQMGPVSAADPRSSTLTRMASLMRTAADGGADIAVFPELALTTFFPRTFMADQREIDAFFEDAVPDAGTQMLFRAARDLGIAFSFGFAERVQGPDRLHRYNTSIIVDRTGAVLHRYRKVHLPGHADHQPWRPFQHLEKRYFEPGPDGFTIVRALGGVLAQAICNDRRWPETYREVALQGAELLLIGYNTPRHYPQAPEHDHLQDFHNHLCLQAGAYQNGMWVAAAAKAGREDGCDLIGGSCIVAPTGEIVARAETLGDEVVIADCDLDRCAEIRDNIFDFAKHRRPDAYTHLARG